MIDSKVGLVLPEELRSCLSGILLTQLAKLRRVVQTLVVNGTKESSLESISSSP